MYDNVESVKTAAAAAQNTANTANTNARAAQTTANAALPTAGGTMIGGITWGENTLTGADGTLTWRGKELLTEANITIYGLSAPDYTAGVSVNFNTEYIAERNCWLLVYAYANAENTRTVTLTVDGHNISIGSNRWNTLRIMFPCKKGSIYKATVSGAAGSQGLTVYPCIGV